MIHFFFYPVKKVLYSIKTPVGFFVEIDKLILKCIWGFKWPQIATPILKKNHVGGLTLSNLKTYHEGIVAKTVCYWHMDRHTDQWNRLEIPEINPYICGQLIFSKGAKVIP